MSDRMTTEYSPGSREIAAVVVELWQKEPGTEDMSFSKLLTRVKEIKAESSWVLSEKRMKSALKEFNLQPNQPKFTFVKQTVSSIPPDFVAPFGIQLQQSKARGKGLYATKNFREGDKLWDEEPLVQAGAVDMLRLMRSGKACAYCAKLLRTTPDGKPLPREGVACLKCTGNWCSNNCKRQDLGHNETHHLVPLKTNARKPPILMSKWKIYEQFCMDQNWNAGYLYAETLLHRIKQPGGPRARTHYNMAMYGMASIRQDVRQQAIAEPDSLEFEQYEQMWQKGHRLLSEAVEPSYKLTYEEYLTGIGMANINNIRGCIFATHANLNHSCEPNVRVVFKTDSKAQGLVVYARDVISEGQELLTSYVDIAFDLDRRQYELRVNWGFICSCSRCKREKEARNRPKIVPAKPALKPSPPQSPVDGKMPEDPSKKGHRARSKSVHFDQNPVSLEIPAS